MARPAKRGLSYFTRTVDFYSRPAIMELLDKYGPMGVTVYDIILTMVYHESYYLAIPLDRLASQIIRLIGNRWVNNKDLVMRVIRYCGEIGLFDDDLLRQGVITSAQIQEHYAEVTVRSKADKSKYWLLEDDMQPGDRIPVKVISPEKTRVFAAETPVTAENNPQKQSKEKEKKTEALKQSDTYGISPVEHTAAHTVQAAPCSAALAEFSRIKEPTFGEQLRLGELCAQYGEHQVTAAIRDAVKKRGRSLKYVEVILEDMSRSAPAAHSTAEPVRQSAPEAYPTADPFPSWNGVPEPPSRNGRYLSYSSYQEVEDMLNEEWMSDDGW